jgi:hypothetical protein
MATNYLGTGICPLVLLLLLLFVVVLAAGGYGKDQQWDGYLGITPSPPGQAATNSEHKL